MNFGNRPIVHIRGSVVWFGDMTVSQGLALASFGLRKDVKLLVVDDHTEGFDELRDVADMYSPDFRIECKLATSGAEARELASSWQPSVVLVDLHLANTETLTLLRHLSELGTPVVATSSERRPDIEQTVQDYGAAGYVQKSTSLEELETLVNFVAALAIPVEPTH